MSQKRLFIPKKRDILMFSTSVENLFINELLPIAPGDYVKVYLFMLMHAEYECELDRETASRVLGLSEEEIDNAVSYWEDKGALVREYDPEIGEYRIAFVSQIETFYGAGPYVPEQKEAELTPVAGPESEEVTPMAKPGEIFEMGGASSILDEPPTPKANDTEYIDDDMAKIFELEMRGLFTTYEESTGRPISRKESDKIRDAVNVYGVTPDVFSYAIKYCTELEKYSIDYIFKVAIRWTEEGCKDISQVKDLIDRDSKRNAAYHRIFREMGFSRLPSPGDREIMSRWFDEWGLKLDEIIAACRKSAGLREPTLNYVNKILENQMKEKGGIKTTESKHPQEKGETTNVSKKVLGDYYEYLRNVADLEYQDHMAEAESIPMMKETLALEKEFNRAIVSLDFSPKAKEDRKTKLAKRKELDEEKRRILVANGYPANYLDKVFKCDVCKDTGVLDNGMYCSCVKERAAEAYKWNQKRKNKK